MSGMTGSIFIIEQSGGVLMFEDVRHAERALESTDVEEGEYQAAFDEHGRRFLLEAPKGPGRGRLLGIEWVEPREVALRPTEEHAPQELRARLVSALERAGEKLPTTITLDEAIARFAAVRSRKG